MTTPMETYTWVEIWIVSVIPLLLYLGTVYHAFRLNQKPQMQRDVHWRWSFVWIQLAIVGATLIRVRALALLWYAGRADAWAVVDPELLVAAWCVGVGLLVHVYLLDTHPIWQTSGPKLLRPKEPD